MMRNYSQNRKFPLGYANYVLLFTGLVFLLLGGLMWVSHSNRPQSERYPAISTTEVTGTVKGIHIPHRSEYITFTLNEYENTFELFDWFDRYDRFDLFLDAENDPSIPVTLTVDEEEWRIKSSCVPVYGITVDGVTVFTKEEYVSRWEKDDRLFPWMAGGAVLVGVVILLWGWLWREKPKWYSPFGSW